jgi:hypothetical protein
MKFKKLKEYGLLTLADLEAGKIDRALVKAEANGYVHALQDYLNGMKQPRFKKEFRSIITSYLEEVYADGRKNGSEDQFNLTIDLFNRLRNGRFQLNDDVKMTIDMLKDEMTRELMKNV